MLRAERFMRASAKLSHELLVPHELLVSHERSHELPELMYQLLDAWRAACTVCRAAGLAQSVLTSWQTSATERGIPSLR